MFKTIKISLALLISILLAACGQTSITSPTPTSADPPQVTETNFTIRIENVSTANTLATSTGSVAVPLSPGAYIVHSGNKSPLLEPRNPAGKALEAVAEDGNAALFPTEVVGSKVFNTPIGADAPGPIFPGGAYEFKISAKPGDKLSFVTMFVQSNDWFYSTTDEDDSISLFDAAGNAVSGDVSNQIALWESATEVDEEAGTGPNQAPRQVGPNTGTPEVGTVGSLRGKGKTVVLNGDVIRVTVTPEGQATSQTPEANTGY